MANAVIGALRVVLGLDSAEFTSGINRANRSTRDFAKQGKIFEGAARGMTAALRGVAGALGIATIGAAGRAYLSVADQSKQMTAQLQLATAQLGSFGRAQEDVKRIAGETRQGLMETTALYGNMIRAAQTLGVGQGEAARATETFSKALKLGGASAAEAGSATLQFGQALASGVLRGDELNSIMEASPRLARLIAESLGVTTGKLREMGAEGELTADKLMRALTDQKFTKGIDNEFRTLPLTFDDAVQQITNAAVVTFGAFDEGGEFSTAIANFVAGGSSGFAGMGRAAEQLGIDVRAVLNGLGGAFSEFEGSAVGAFVAAKNEAVSFGDTIEALIGLLDIAANAARNVYDPRALRIARGADASPIDMAGEYRKERNSSQTRLKRNALDRDIQRRIGFGAGGAEGWWTGNPEGRKSPTAVLPSDKKKSRGRVKSAETLRKEADREAQRAADALRMFADEVSREQADIASAMAELTGRAEEAAAAQLNQIETQREIRNRQIDAERELSAAQREQLKVLNDDRAMKEKALVEQREAERKRKEAEQIESDRLGLQMELLGLTANVARTAKERRDVELRILDLQFQQERIQLEGVIASRDATDADKAYAEARLAQIDALQAGAKAQVMQRTQGPLESYLDRLPRTAEEMNEAFQGVAADGLGSVIDGLAAAATGTAKLGDVFKRVTQQIVADLIRIQLQRAMAGALSNALGGILGGGGEGADIIVNRGSSSGLTGTGGIFGDPSWVTKRFGFPVFGGPRAKGGPVSRGSAYLVGEKGPEFFMPNVSGSVMSHKKSMAMARGGVGAGNDGGRGGIAQIVPSPYFDVVVDGRIVTTAGPMSVAAAQDGSMGAQQAMARRSQRTIP